MQRLYRDEGLGLEPWLKRRRRAAEHLRERLRVTEANQAWSLDIETFNGPLRAECLDTNWFGTLEEAKENIEAWRR